MRADSNNYALSTSAVAIRGGIYALVAGSAGGQLQMLAPDNSTWAPVQTVDLATPISAIAGCLTPIYLPAGQVKLASGSGWLVGIGYSMAQSQTDICNSALLRVGAATIMSITDNSREARACNVNYDSNRRAELRKRAWNFAIKRAVLAPSATSPNFEFVYGFPLPADCIRIILPKDDPSIDWVEEGRQICTNLVQSPYLGSGAQPNVTGPALFLRYIYDVTDATQFDPLFYDLLCISLACDLCEPLTQSNQKKQLLNAEYKDALEAAAKAKAFEMLPQSPVVDDWVLARVR